jgi:hypothetical protein
VKSTRGKDLGEATFLENVIVGDTLFAFEDIAGENDRGFLWPWITASQEPELLLNEPERFRENICVKWGNEKPFYEDEIIGKLFSIGSEVSIRILERKPLESRSLRKRGKPRHGEGRR